MAVPYRRLRHEVTRTSKDSARARGEPLEIGAKALVLKCDASFAVFVMSAARLLDSQAVKAMTASKQVRFATKDELFQLTGLEPGSVPPFGRPIVELDLYVDASICLLDRVAFNAGSLTESLVMSREDYVRAAAPKPIASFSRAEA